MKIAIIAACPNGAVTSVIAASVLASAARRLGWTPFTETRSLVDGQIGPAETSGALAEGDRDALDWVLYVGAPADGDARFAALPRISVSLREALADPETFLKSAQARISADPEAFVLASRSPDTTPPAAPSSGLAGKTIVAVTACPTGVAHTFMAAQALELAAAQAGATITIETRGSVGARNPLTAQAIAAADVVVLATDIEVDTQRFAGKRVFRCGTGIALKDPNATLLRALAEARVSGAAAPGAAARGTSAPDADTPGATRTDGYAGAESDKGHGANLYKHLLTGVSYMLPMVVAGGLLIALSFVFGIEAFKEPGTLAAALKQIGDAAFLLMVPVLAGYIAYSIADRPGLAPGMIGGVLAGTLGAGFIGGIVAGFLGGYSARLINSGLRLPQSVESLKPILIIPLAASLITGLGMIYLVGEPVAVLLRSMTAFLENMGTTNAIALGVVLGAMMCVDLGGPINKAAYAFTVGLLASNVHGPMAVTMAAGMVPPIGMALATLGAPRRFTVREREAGKAAGVLGMCFISEGAIPFAAKDPLRVIPASVVGGAITGALVAWFGCRLVAPHGGFFVLLIPNAMNRPWMYIAAIVIGGLVTAAIYAYIKPRPQPQDI